MNTRWLLELEPSDKISDRCSEDRPVVRPSDHHLAQRDNHRDRGDRHGRNLKHRVIAEGVETQEELVFLQAHRCDEAQGHYFGCPMSPQEFATALKNRTPAELVLG